MELASTKKKPSSPLAGSPLRRDWARGWGACRSSLENTHSTVEAQSYVMTCAAPLKHAICQIVFVFASVSRFASHTKRQTCLLWAKGKTLLLLLLLLGMPQNRPSYDLPFKIGHRTFGEGVGLECCNLS